MLGFVIVDFSVRFSPLLAVSIWALIVVIFIWRHTTTLIQESTHRSQEIQNQTQFWESQRAQQPTDRDILVNLAKLYAAQGNQVQAEKYLQEAHQIDPNFPF